MLLCAAASSKWRSKWKGICCIACTTPYSTHCWRFAGRRILEMERFFLKGTEDKRRRVSKVLLKGLYFSQTSNVNTITHETNKRNMFRTLEVVVLGLFLTIVHTNLWVLASLPKFIWGYVCVLTRFVCELTRKFDIRNMLLP